MNNRMAIDDQGPRVRASAGAVRKALAMRGYVKVRAYRRGKFLWQRETENLIVTAHNVPTANLLAGVFTNQQISAFGVGSGTAPVAITDTGLTTPAYYKAVDSHSFPVSGQVEFAFSLVGGTDTGAYGISISEVGLFCNTGAVSLPANGTPSMTLFAHALLGLGTYASSLTYNLTWLITT